MKRSIIKKILLATLLSVSSISIYSCSGYFDLDDNPNLIKEQPINTFLTTATHKTGLNSQRFADFIMYYTQYLASPSASGISDTYQISNNSTAWNNAYWALADLYDFKQTALAASAMYHVGVANVLTAYHLTLVNDTWGSGPFSQAFALNNVLTPTYDSDEQLYRTSVDLINDAIDQLSSTDQPALGSTEDLIHGGNRANWLKTAYALQARLLNKVSKKSEYNPQAVLNAVANAYTSNNDDAKMGVFNGNQAWAQMAISNASNLLGGWLSDNFVNHLNGETYGLFDPRIEKITDRTVHGVYVGTRNGQGNVGGANTVRDECYISLNSPLTNRESPLYIITYAEIKFIEAEAALAASDPTRAYTAYLEGIRANMERLGVAPSDVATYIAAPQVAVGEAGLTKKIIFKEKYVVTYLNPEAWNDMRRNDYDYEGFRLPMNAQLDEPIRQVAYPQDELNRNGANVPAQGSLADRLWFDQP